MNNFTNLRKSFKLLLLHNDQSNYSEKLVNEAHLISWFVLITRYILGVRRPRNPLLLCQTKKKKESSGIIWRIGFGQPYINSHNRE